MKLLFFFSIVQLGIAVAVKLHRDATAGLSNLQPDTFYLSAWIIFCAAVIAQEIRGKRP